jgi:hypothetical protein
MKEEIDVDLEFKGRKIRKIVFAETTKVDEHKEIAEEFMEKIFGMKPGRYLISDESSLSDFTERKEMEDLKRRIHDVFGVDVSDIKNGYLVEVFERIDMKRTS